MNIEFLSKIKSDKNLSKSIGDYIIYDVKSLKDVINFKDSLNFKYSLDLESNPYSSFVDNDIVVYDDFVDFIVSSNGKIYSIYNQSIVEHQINGKQKPIPLGFFKIEINEYNFYLASFLLNSKDNEIVTVIFSVKKEFTKYVDFKNAFNKYKNKNHVFINENCIKIPDEFAYTKLVNGNLVKETSDKINSFFSNSEFFVKNNLQFLQTLSLIGEYGSGRCTFIKSLAKELDCKFIVLSSSTTNESFVSAFTKAEKEKSVLYFEYIENWINEIDQTLFKDLIDSTKPEDGLFIIVSSTKEDNIPQQLVKRKTNIGCLKFNLPDETVIKAYLSEFNMDDKTVKSIIKDFKANKLTWNDLYLLRNDLFLEKHKEGDSSKEINTEAKELVKKAVKTKKSTEKKIDLNQYFKEESE